MCFYSGFTEEIIQIMTGVVNHMTARTETLTLLEKSNHSQLPLHH